MSSIMSQSEVDISQMISNFGKYITDWHRHVTVDIKLSSNFGNYAIFDYPFIYHDLYTLWKFLYPHPTKLEGGVYWIHLVRPSVRPSVRLSVDDMVSGA